MTACTTDMPYDARTPSAVFLGPSLDLATARAILPANYYAPVRMGDVYRLLATGVRLIVIIDGVFHAAAPVWPREILAALKAGITVVGAGSMGALRAAELAPYGMIGCGTVFQWYVEGRIAGDDEVALLHAHASQGYRSVCEALVNMRHTLARACQAGILAPDACADLLAWLKGLFYGHRTYAALFASPPFARLSQSTQQALRTFVLERRYDLKRQDAVHTLQLCAAYGQRIGALAAASLTPDAGVTRPVEIWHRGALTATGQLLPLYDLLRVAAQERQATQTIIAQASRRFFLLQWMQQHNVQLPAAAHAAFYTRWCQQHVSGELAPWLAANGITRQEFERAVAERAAEAWLLAQDPATYGLSWHEPRNGLANDACPTARCTAYPQEPLGVPSTTVMRDDCATPAPRQRQYREVSQDVAARCYLQDWAQHCGIDGPADVGQGEGPHAGTTLARGEEAGTARGALQDGRSRQVQWLLERGPVFFGCMEWSAELAFARHLQVTGKIAELARARGDATYERHSNVSLRHPSAGVA